MWITSPALAQTVLFHDGFNTDGPNIDRTKWTGPATAYFLGRTQLRLASAPVAVVGGAAVLTFDTFNSATPGTFRGVEIETNQYFPVSTGLAFEARVKPAANLPRGLVTSLFSYVFRDLGGGVRQQDEIDWEFLTNQLVGRTQPVVSTNVYVDEFLGAGSPVLVGLPDTTVLGEWNTLRVEWYPNRVRWLVNGQLVFERTDRVPNDAMSVRLNFWAPDSSWTAAYSSALTPAATAEQNQTFQYLVDYVTVYRLPGLATGDLDADGRFSIDDLYRISLTNQDVNASGTIDTNDQQAVAFPLRAREAELMAGRSPRTIVVNPGFDAAAPSGPITRWTLFGNTIGNVSRSSEAPRNDGSALKIYGQFTGGANESGAYQDFDIRAGRTITARVWARQRCADRFTGANTATLNLRFLNAAGAIISTSTVLAGNASTPCDQYAQVTLTATAPPGTATTRLLLRVSQPASAAGAVHFDDVELSVQ